MFKSAVFIKITFDISLSRKYSLHTNALTTKLFPDINILCSIFYKGNLTTHRGTLARKRMGHYLNTSKRLSSIDFNGLIRVATSVQYILILWILYNLVQFWDPWITISKTGSTVFLLHQQILIRSKWVDRSIPFSVHIWKASLCGSSSILWLLLRFQNLIMQLANSHKPSFCSHQLLLFLVHLHLSRSLRYLYSRAYFTDCWQDACITYYIPIIGHQVADITLFIHWVKYPTLEYTPG